MMREIERPFADADHNKKTSKFPLYEHIYLDRLQQMLQTYKESCADLRNIDVLAP